MTSSKKSQFIVLSTTFLLLLLLVVYSLGTQKPYIAYSSEKSVLQNILEESCTVGELSNGSYLDDRFSNFTSSVQSYCLGIGFTCTLNISRDTGEITNLSQLSYLNFTYSLFFKGDAMSYNSSFTC